MKTLVKSLMVTVLAIAMAFTPEALNAQARRSATGTTSGSSATRSSNTSGSSSAATQSTQSRRSANVGSAASSSSVSRSSGSASSSAVQQSSGSASRSSAQQSSTTRRSSTQQSGMATRTEAPQSGTTRRSAATTSGNTAPASSGSNASGTSTTSRRSASGTANATPSAASSTSATRSGQSTANRRSAATTAGREATTIDNSGQRRTSAVSRTSGNATANKGLTSVKETAKVGNAASQARISNFGGRDANMRLDNHEVLRVPPRERDRVMAYDVPAHFFTREPHYFGYRIQALPPRPHRMVHWGVTYYYYNNVYYRPWGSVYVVCRPPFGVCVERAMVSATLRSLRFAYYHNAYYTYREIDANYRVIDEQNRIIARNNATIAAQNATMALNANRAYSAYELANQLGLVQSYANAATEYFYEDGVFFVINAKGQYEVIVPPAGALVSELPDDYETLVMNGIEYYRVDNTVYRVTLVDGTPYLEVLGQMPTKIAKQYGYVF